MVEAVMEQQREDIEIGRGWPDGDAAIEGNARHGLRASTRRPMPPATAAAFTGIHNENEFYSHHYLSEIFGGGHPGHGGPLAEIRGGRGGADAPTPRCAPWPATTCGSAATSTASAAADSG